MGWQISATETNLKPSVNTANTKTLLHGKGYGDISCVSGFWTFTYSILGTIASENGTRTVNKAVNKKETNSNALRLFVQDLHGVAAIREVHSAIEKIVSTSDLADFFKIHAVGPTSIHIKCQGEGFPECTASIEWKGAAGITIDFSPTNNPFSPFLQRILTSTISFLLHVRHSLELVHHVSYYLDHPAIPLLPGDIVIIPRRGDLMRMVYRSSYGVDFRIAPEGIKLEDAGEPGPYNGISGGPQRERIPQQKLTAFVEEKKSLLGNLQPPSLPAVLRTLHSWLTASEAEAVSQFWRLHVAAPPFRPSSLISFIRILALPIVPLKEFAEIMAMSQRLKTDRDTEQVTLCLAHTVGSKQHETVVHLAASGEIAFILRFIPANSHHTTPPPPPPPPSLSSSLALSSATVRPAEPHSSTTEIGLCYKYATHSLRVWPLVCGGVEEDAAHADLLERAIARARKVENAGESLPAVVRALLVERNPTAT